MKATAIIAKLYQDAVADGGARLTLASGITIGIGFVKVRGGMRSASNHGRVQYNVDGKTKGRAAMVRAIEDAQRGEAR